MNSVCEQPIYICLQFAVDRTLVMGVYEKAAKELASGLFIFPEKHLFSRAWGAQPLATVVRILGVRERV